MYVIDKLLAIILIFIAFAVGGMSGILFVSELSKEIINGVTYQTVQVYRGNNYDGLVLIRVNDTIASHRYYIRRYRDGSETKFALKEKEEQEEQEENIIHIELK